MEDIKFRVWDTVGKVMLDWSTINQTAFNCQTIAQQHKSNKCYQSFLYTVFNDPRLIKMQYTGRKDKDGKEIYKGDILQAVNPNDRLTFSVKWYDYGGFNLLGINTDAFKVIGNIYKNPELLNTK